MFSFIWFSYAKLGKTMLKRSVVGAKNSINFDLYVIGI